MEENPDKLQFQHLAGGDITKFPPLFSPDASLTFVIIDKVVQVFSASTGHTVRFLEGANDALISLEYNMLDSAILVACTQAGEVISWKWSTGKIIDRVELQLKGGFRYDTFHLINSYVGDAACAFITAAKGKDPVQCFVVSTSDGRVINYSPLNWKFKRQKAIVDVDKEHFKYIVLAQGSLIFFLDYTTWKWTKLASANKVPITCVKVHPKEQMIATGDEMGRVMLWRQFFGAKDSFRTTLYHWHHTRVTSIAFSYSGSGIYSSGLEAVLVRWNIQRPDKRQFVPRMSSIILHIATSQENTSVAVSTADNGIQILDVDFKTKSTLQEFTYIFNDKTDNQVFPVGLKINPRQNTLVLNGRTGHLQFYSAYTRNLLYNMDVVDQNQVSMETEKILYNIQVIRSAFNIDWMATVELFNDEQNMPELRLKFWQYQKAIQSYALNTCVELPHDGGINAIEFSSPYHVDNLLCATAGLDDVIKIWSLEDSNNIYKKGKVWFCIGQTRYKNFPVDSIGFSQDGSLLAAGFGNTLCVYKAASLKLLAALVPNGSFDGCLRKAQLAVPKQGRNGSKNDTSAKKQKVIQLFVSLLQANDETLLKEIKKSVSSKKVHEIHSLDDSQKVLLYKRIKSMGQLNFFQKLLIYQQLGFYFKLSQEWRLKVIDYLQENTLTTKKSNELTKQVYCLNLKSRFKAKYRLNKYVDRKSSYDANASRKSLPVTSILLKSNEYVKPPLTNGVGGNYDESTRTSKKVLPPMPAAVAIKKVAFCFGDFAHLLIACTEKRVLIWNLLTLRLQTVLKLTTEHIAVDSQTNLISVFTKNNELYVFLPSVALPLYFRANMPSIYGAVWLPRRYPKSQAVIVNWQSRSTLYFLTENQEIMYLAANDEYEQPSVAFAEPADSSAMQYSTFGAFAVNKFNNTKKSRSADGDVAIGVHGKAAVAEFLQMSTHTMAPLSLLCENFLKEVVQLNLPQTKSSSKTRNPNSMDITDDSSNDEDKDDDDETISKRRNFTAELDKISAKAKASTSTELNEKYLQKIAAETISIEF